LSGTKEPARVRNGWPLVFCTTKKPLPLMERSVPEVVYCVLPACEIA